MRKVLCDIDGTLCDILSPIKAYLSTYNKEFSIEDCKHYNFSDYSDDIRSLIFRGFADNELMKMVQPYSYTFDALDRLKSVADVWSYTVFNDKSYNTPEVLRGRVSLIKNLGLKGSPFKCEKPIIHNVDALFDDCLDVMIKWQDTDTKLFLIDQPYNQKTEENECSLDWNRVVRCKNFADGVEKYLQMINERG